MNANDILTIQRSLKENEKIEISHLGEIRISWHNEAGKKKSRRVGNLFENDNSIAPLPVKPWISQNTPALKSWRDFGNKPRTEKKDYLEEIIVSIFQNMVDNSPSEEFYTDSTGLKYEVKYAGEIKGFYFRGTLRFVEFQGKRFYNTVNDYSPHTQIFKKEE